jgi:hypothetical protein
MRLSPSLWPRAKTFKQQLDVVSLGIALDSYAGSCSRGIYSDCIETTSGIPNEVSHFTMKQALIVRGHGLFPLPSFLLFHRRLSAVAIVGSSRFIRSISFGLGLEKFI